MLKSLLFITTILIITQQQLASLPISSDLVLKLTLSMSKLEDQLKYFGTYQQNKYEIYKRVQLTKTYLLQLNTQLIQYNNVILGNGNAAKGNKNIIIGNYNNVTGSNNWIFISNFTGKLNGNLLLGQWIVNIQKDNLILINPRLAISFINDSQNKPIKDKVNNRNHKFCNWKPKSTIATSNNNGYQQFNHYDNQMGYNNQQGTQNNYQNLRGWEGNWGW